MTQAQRLLYTIRVSALTALTLALVSMLAPRAAHATDLRIAAIPIVDYAGLWVCMEKEFCKQAGIDLKFQTLGGGAAIVAAMKGGSLDLGAVGIVPALRARQGGLDLKFVALASAESNHQEGGPQDILLVKDASIKSGKDLEGKTVAVNELRGVGQTWVSAWVAAAGADPGKVKFQEFPPPGMVAAIAQGRADAAQVSEPFRSEGLKLGMTAIAFSQQLQDSIAVAGIVTTEKFLAENEALMKRFVEAFAKSQEYAATHPDEVRKVLVKYTKLGDSAGTVALATYPTAFHRTDIDFWKNSLNRFSGANITLGFDDIVWMHARIAK